MELDRREQIAVKELAQLVDATGSTLCEVHGLSVRSAAELMVEVGDPARFTAGGFARVNGTAPLPASSAEGDHEPVQRIYAEARRKATPRRRRCASSSAT